MLLALSSWHLYPDMCVLGETIRDIKVSDALIGSGGIITVGMHNTPVQADEGIYWSLPLSHFQYYGDGVTVSRNVGLGDSEVTFQRFSCVVLGALLADWGWKDQDLSLPLDILLYLDWKPVPSDVRKNKPKWLCTMVSAVKHYQSAEGVEKDHLTRLIAFGSRRHRLLFDRKKIPGIAPVFGLMNHHEILQSFVSSSQYCKNDRLLENESKMVHFLQGWIQMIGTIYSLDGCFVCCVVHDALRTSDLLYSTQSLKEMKRSVCLDL